MKDLKEQHDCRMKEYKNKAILGQDLKTLCVENLPFLIDCLYQKIEKMEVREEIKEEIFKNQERIMEIASFVAAHTRECQKLTSKDIGSLLRIFKELEWLAEEVVSNPNAYTKELMCKKLILIRELVCANWRGNGLVFQSYESLYQAIGRLIYDFEELHKRGLSLQVFFCLWSCLEKQKNLPESEKLNHFMEFLDGTKKIVPVYRQVYQKEGYQMVSHNAANEIVYSTEKEAELYQLCEKIE